MCSWCHNKLLTSKILNTHKYCRLQPEHQPEEDEERGEGVHQHEVQGEGGPHRDQGERQAFFLQNIFRCASISWIHVGE